MNSRWHCNISDKTDWPTVPGPGSAKPRPLERRNRHPSDLRRAGARQPDDLGRVIQHLLNNALGHARSLVLLDPNTGTVLDQMAEGAESDADEGPEATEAPAGNS